MAIRFRQKPHNCNPREPRLLQIIRDALTTPHRTLTATFRGYRYLDALRDTERLRQNLCERGAWRLTALDNTVWPSALAVTDTRTGPDAFAHPARTTSVKIGNVTATLMPSVLRFKAAFPCVLPMTGCGRFYRRVTGAHDPFETLSQRRT